MLIQKQVNNPMYVQQSSMENLLKKYKDKCKLSSLLFPFMIQI